MFAGLGQAGLLVEPAGEDVVVVDDADAVLQPLPEDGRPRLLAPHHVLDLGRVAEAPDPAPQRVQRLGPVPLAHLAEAPQELGPLLLPQGADAGEDGRGVRRPAAQEAAQVAPQPVDVEVQDVLGDLGPGARPGRPQPAEERALLGRGRLERGEAVLEEAQDHVHVPPLADRPGQLPQHPEGPAHRPAASLAGEQRQGHPQAPPRHPDLVDRLLVARHRPRQLPEDALHPVLEEERGPIVGGCRGGHGSAPGGRQPTTPGPRPGRHERLEWWPVPETFP